MLLGSVALGLMTASAPAQGSPEREAFFGETHVHTSWSFDAYIFGNTVLHGLAISPDLDTITYTLAGAIDPERGWGLREETWRAMEAVPAAVSIRPVPPSNTTW